MKYVRKNKSFVLSMITLIMIIGIILGTIHEIRTCKGKLLLGVFWWECISDVQKR